MGSTWTVAGRPRPAWSPSDDVSLQRGGTRVALGVVVALGISVIATAVGRPRAASA